MKLPSWWGLALVLTVLVAVVVIGVIVSASKLHG